MDIAATSSPPARHSRLALAGWLVLCFAASITGVFVSTNGWYAALHKPSWNPRHGFLARRGTLLYVLMAIAAWLVWREGGWKKTTSAAGIIFVAMVAECPVDTTLFWTAPFRVGLRGNPFTLACAGGNPLVVLASAESRRRFAGALSAWVTFAAALNFTIWRLNP